MKTLPSQLSILIIALLIVAGIVLGTLFETANYSPDSGSYTTGYTQGEKDVEQSIISRFSMMYSICGTSIESAVEYPEIEVGCTQNTTANLLINLGK